MKTRILAAMGLIGVMTVASQAMADEVLVYAFGENFQGMNTGDALPTAGDTLYSGGAFVNEVGVGGAEKFMGGINWPGDIPNSYCAAPSADPIYDRCVTAEWLGFSSGTANLTLTDAGAATPTHTKAVISFDVVQLGSWDNDEDFTFALNGVDLTPDSVTQGLPIDADYQWYLGATDTWYDMTYRIIHYSYEVAHTANYPVLGFTWNSTQPIDDESWGLDNISVLLYDDVEPQDETAIPVPALAGMLLAGAAVMVRTRMKRA